MSSIQSSAAAATIGNINDDLLITILLFFPTKFLLRFKLVSKQWRSLISDPHFCRCHTLNHPRRRTGTETQPLFIVVNNLRSKYIVYSPTIRRSFPFTLPSGLPKVLNLQSCNGLLLLHYAEKGEERYYVFNPTTMQQRELSPPIRRVDGMYLMFDPSLSLHYKVVCFARGTIVYLYDSETHKWRQLEGERNGIMDLRLEQGRTNGTYFNGGIYFTRPGSSGSSLSRFDPENNVRDIPNPAQFGDYTAHAMVSNGYLHCFTKSWKKFRGRADEVLNVWEMKGDGNRWRKKYEVDVNRSLANSGIVPGWRSMSFLGVVRGEDEQDSMMLVSLDGRIMIYKFHDDVFKVDDCVSSEFRKDAHPFIPTLAPV